MRILLVELESHFPLSTFLKAQLQKKFGMEVTLNHRLLHVPHDFFDIHKLKWDAEKIISFLHGNFHAKQEGKFMVLAVFPYDMFADSLNFIYGLGERGGNYAVMSHFRLDEKYYGRAHSDKLFKERVLKEAIHEIGHIAGIEHCRSKKCVMTFSPNIIFVDRKGSDFCERCRLFL
ncbi:MAG: archaemetzincin family Zn-dependent metalloprotease [Candidatus Micrarchaeota archaeon]